MLTSKMATTGTKMEVKIMMIWFTKANINDFKNCLAGQKTQKLESLILLFAIINKPFSHIFIYLKCNKCKTNLYVNSNFPCSEYFLICKMHSSQQLHNERLLPFFLDEKSRPEKLIGTIWVPLMESAKDWILSG